MKRRNIFLPLFQMKTADASGVARLQICTCCYSIMQQEQNLSRQELIFSHCLLHEAAAFTVTGNTSVSAPVGMSRLDTASLDRGATVEVTDDNSSSDDDDKMYSWSLAESRNAVENSSPSRGGVMRLSPDVVHQASVIASGSCQPADHQLSTMHRSAISRMRSAPIAPQVSHENLHACCIYIEPSLLRSFNSLVSVDSTEVFTIKYSLLNCSNYFTFLFQKGSNECAGGVGCHWYLSEAQLATIFCRKENIVFSLMSGDGYELGSQTLSLAPLSESMVLVHEFVGRFESNSTVRSGKTRSPRGLSFNTSGSLVRPESPGTANSRSNSLSLWTRLLVSVLEGMQKN
jgi:hypothetical protein